MGKSKLSPQRVAAAERARKALELRIAGVGFEAIARQLEYCSAGAAYTAIDRLLKRTAQEPADKLRQMERERLDRMLLAVWPRVRNGEDSAVASAIKIMDRRARLLGLDAPVKLAPTDPTGEQEYRGLSDADLVRELAEFLDGLGTRARGETSAGGETPLDAACAPTQPTSAEG